MHLLKINETPHDIKGPIAHHQLPPFDILFVSLLVSFFIAGAAAGFLWLFVFGDSNWSPYFQRLIPVVSVLLFLALWIAFIVMGINTGKKYEDRPELNRHHLVVSAAATILPIVINIFHQAGVGNIGTKSDGIVCSEFCREKGYPVSGMPPRDSGLRDCICYSDSGREVLTVSITSILAGK